MHPGEANRPDTSFAPRDEMAGMRLRIADQDRAVSALTAIVDRQVNLIERYDSLLSASRASAERDRPLNEALDRAIMLLDQAVAGVERRARDVASLEAQLDRTLGLLDQSLKNQETMFGRGFDSTRPAMPHNVEQTLAKYDQMLERSLAALETAYRANQSTQKEVGDRDRLLKKTMDLLENTVEASNASPRRQGFLGRLFA
jgi:chromosome segregation ATPase